MQSWEYGGDVEGGFETPHLRKPVTMADAVAFAKPSTKVSQRQRRGSRCRALETHDEDEEPNEPAAAPTKPIVVR